MRVFFVVVLGLLFLAMLPHTVSAAPASTPPAIQQTGTALRTTSYVLTFWQNGSAMFATGTTVANVPFTLSGATYTAITGATLTLTVSMHNGMVPMANVSQSGTTLANTTVPYSFTISPTVSSAPVAVRIPAAFTSTGATPSIASYSVYLNASQSITYVVLAPTAWVLSAGINESLSFPVVVPTSYTLNSTTVFLPFAQGSSANVSSITLKLGGLAWPAYQVVAGGLYVSIYGISVTTTIAATYLVVPVQTGGVPSIPLGPVFSIGGGLWIGNATWANTRTLPYSGEILITANTSYPILATSLTVTVGTKALSFGKFIVAGGFVEIVPGAVVVNPGTAIVFKLTFALVGAPPTFSIAVGDRVYGAFTVGDTIIAIELILLLYLILAWFYYRATHVHFDFKNAPSGFWLAIVVFVILWLLYVALSYGVK